MWQKKRIEVLVGVPATEARNWRIEGRKRRTTRKENQRLVNKFEMEGFMAQKGLWNLAIEKILRERGALPMEEGHAVREHKAMNEENLLSSWLREDGREKEESKVKVSIAMRMKKKGAKRGEEKERKKRTKR